MLPRPGLIAVKNTKIPCRESKADTSIVKNVAESLC
jgi:hypothetical protein